MVERHLPSVDTARPHSRLGPAADAHCQSGTAGQPSTGVTQKKKWVIQILHLLVGLGAIGQMGELAARIKQARAPALQA